MLLHVEETMKMQKIGEKCHNRVSRLDIWSVTLTVIANPEHNKTAEQSEEIRLNE